jgi:ribosomal protein uL22
MAPYKYSVKAGKNSARAQAHDVDVSYKDLGEAARAVKGRKVADAYKALDEAIALKHAIPFKKHAKGCGHRSELGGKKGRYAVKACRIVKKVLENAVANAVNQGLDESKLFVKAARAYKQGEYPRYKKFWVSSATLGYGKRAIWSNYITSRLEIVVEEGAPPKPRPQKTRRKTHKRYRRQ